MIGPTGVGKTEIARRLAALVGAPFVKVEATKYTEVGYVGRDVESMVRDLVEAVDSHGHRRAPRRGPRARRRARRSSASIDVLHPETRAAVGTAQGNPFAATLGSIFGNNVTPASSRPQPAPSRRRSPRRRAAHSRADARRDRARLLRRAADRDRSRGDAEPADRHDRRRPRISGGRHRRDARRFAARSAGRRSA